MVKQKHHTARNQTYKHHRNGIKKAPRTKFIKLSGVSRRAPAFAARLARRRGAARTRPASPPRLPHPKHA